MLKSLLAGKNTQVKGFIELTARVPNENLKNLASDRLVFLVDPSADASLTSNPEKDTMPGVFWDLENSMMVAE